MIERKYLQNIREVAVNKAKCQGLNSSWKRAYEALADSADRLDAMNARCEDREKEVVKNVKE